MALYVEMRCCSRRHAPEEPLFLKTFLLLQPDGYGGGGSSRECEVPCSVALRIRGVAKNFDGETVIPLPLTFLLGKTDPLYSSGECTNHWVCGSKMVNEATSFTEL
jgi:hypothetical protein